jgi:hypothetical protein
MFSEKEIAYLKSQRLGRIATVLINCSRMSRQWASISMVSTPTLGDSLNHPVIERNFARQIRIAARRYTLTNLL